MTYRIEGFADACKICDGCDAESFRETLAEAKACARYFISADACRFDSFPQLDRALVYNARNECVVDVQRVTSGDAVARDVARFFRR